MRVDVEVAAAALAGNRIAAVAVLVVVRVALPCCSHRLCFF